MTDKEAYEVFAKFSGEAGMSKMKEVIHIRGMESSIQLMSDLYLKEKGIQPNDEFLSVMRQAFQYIMDQSHDLN